MARNKDPVLIAVLGETGSGKTTFISKATGRNDMEIGHGLTSCTQEIQLASLELDGQKIVLIDTPGFDDTDKPDTEILKLIAENLSVTYEAGKLLNGVILLQKINTNRVTGSEAKRTRLFQKICGENAFANVIIASTMWAEASNQGQLGVFEQERINNADFWGKMINKGAKAIRHHNTTRSTKMIIGMLANKTKTVLQMQRELKDNGGNVSQTSAGRQMDSDLSEVCARLVNDLAEARAESRQSTEDMQEEIRQLTQQLTQIERERQSLLESKISWPRRTVNYVAEVIENAGDWMDDKCNFQ